MISTLLHFVALFPHIQHWHREVVDSPSLEMFKSHGDVALRDKVSGHDGSGLGLELMILEVFSNLSDSMIRRWLWEALSYELIFPVCPLQVPVW